MRCLNDTANFLFLGMYQHLLAIFPLKYAREPCIIFVESQFLALKLLLKSTPKLDMCSSSTIKTKQLWRLAGFKGYFQYICIF